MEEKYIEINISNKKAKTKEELFKNLYEAKDSIKEDEKKYNALVNALSWFEKNMKIIDLPKVLKSDSKYYRLGSNFNSDIFSIQEWEKYSDKFDKRVRNIYSNFENDMDNDENTIIIV